jgi:uncharacterized protein
MNAPQNDLENLLGTLGRYSQIAVAVSGGVDSMTLATLIHRHSDAQTQIFHAVSPAVPAEATRRVRSLAMQESWALTVIDAGEFDDDRYRTNPVNRCYYCKSNLYDAIAPRTSAQIVSGANLDDLGEYRPGLEAAAARGVRHPYVEAGVGKQSVRRIARWLALPEIAELPASPCLASRIETGIAIDPAMLGLVHRVEQLIGRSLAPRTVRCRIRATGVVIELDEDCLNQLDSQRMTRIRARALDLVRDARYDYDVRFESYRVGSAFLTGTEQI